MAHRCGSASARAGGCAAPASLQLRLRLLQCLGCFLHRVLRLRRSYWEDSAPRLWPPPDTYGETRRLALRVLPGARYRRRLLWRYSLVWQKHS